MSVRHEQELELLLLLLLRELPCALRLRSLDVRRRGWMMMAGQLEDLLPELTAAVPRQQQSGYALSLLQPACLFPANECLLSSRAR